MTQTTTLKQAINAVMANEPVLTLTSSEMQYDGQYDALTVKFDLSLQGRAISSASIESVVYCDEDGVEHNITDYNANEIMADFLDKCSDEDYFLLTDLQAAKDWQDDVKFMNATMF